MKDKSYRHPNKAFWLNKKVFITGHTGFKGSWLCLLLLYLGCDVYGISSSYPSNPCLFKQLELQERLTHFMGDIRDPVALKNIVLSVQPDVVFHLAAQPLVRESYRDPVNTWSSNVLGTINLMEALRPLKSLCAAVMITTDKVYQNKEWFYSYRENDPLGGYDPYSSSKAAAEIAISSWRSSFFGLDKEHSNIILASARSGNVIGGGDWAVDRIVPDIVRSLMDSVVIDIRNPYSTRPWQHVLEPLAGYLLLAEALYTKPSVSNSFNFGPSSEGNRTVSELVEEALKIWPGTWKMQRHSDKMHEANLLNLATDLSCHELGWSPRWDFSQTISRTISWYKQVFYENESPYESCMIDLKAFFSDFV